jgi:hypothetical protein
MPLVHVPPYWHGLDEHSEYVNAAHTPSVEPDEEVIGDVTDLQPQ